MEIDKKNIIHNQIQHDKVALFYNSKHKEIYNSYEQERLDGVISSIIQVSTDFQELNVLDFGAGTGNLTRIFSTKGYKVTACDVSQKSLDILRNNLPTSNITTTLYNGTKLPFIDNTFDITATYSVLHHIPDYLSAVKEMIRVTKRGGMIYIEHEANHNRWDSPAVLKEYYSRTRQTTL
ncbi:MAG: class I SAM-dependent methyltransferase, partial [Bacteroidota bacterium]